MNKPWCNNMNVESMDNKLVIKITGKAFTKDNIDYLNKILKTIRNLVEKGYRIAIVAGGGNTARNYIELASLLGVKSNYLLDIIGIEASRLNALVIAYALSNIAYNKVVEDPSELNDLLKIYSVVVLGGLIPGQSTAAVAVEVAEAINAEKIVNLGAIDKVYDKDPSIYPDAKPFTYIKASDLKKFLEQSIIPGKYQLLDIHSIDLALRSKITIVLCHYKKPEKIIDYIEKGENPGTIILPE